MTQEKSTTQNERMPKQMLPSGFAYPDDRVTLRDVLLFMWRSRWIALVTALACGILAAAAAFLVTPKFTAEATLFPVSESGGSLGLGGLGSAGSGLSGLASLVGVNLNSTENITEEAVATLQSNILRNQYIEQHNLLPILFWKEWNPIKKTWRVHDKSKMPTLWKADQLLDKICVVVNDPKTGLITVDVSWKDAHTAAKWANGLVRLTNNYLRKKAINQAERSINFLNEEAAKTDIVGVKAGIYGLMEAEIQNEMVARSRRNFALKVIDPAVAPERQSSPKPVLWIVGGLFVGLFLGLIASGLRESLAAQGAETELSKQGTESLARDGVGVETPKDSA